nr:cytochrome c3 family protein [Aurantimonas sp. CSK15Z-1]
MVLLSIVLLPTLAIFLTYLVMRSSTVTGQDFVLHQWPPFSHAHHAGELGIGCRMCHNSVEKAASAGMPSTHVCMTCHSQIWTNAPMLAPVRESLADDKPLHWTRVNDLPDYVYFDHSVHVNNGVGCSTCHGPVDTMPLMRQAAPLTMGWCLDCHRSPEKFVRPTDKIYDFDWQPPADQEEKGKRLLVQYHIETSHLTDCSVCHR